MRAKKQLQLTPMDVVAASYLCSEALAPLVRLLGADHPNIRRATVALIEGVKRQYGRKIRVAALRDRRRWKTADVAALLRLPGASAAANRRIARLMEKSSLGPGVIPPPRSFEDAGAVALRLVDPATSPGERREIRKTMPKFPDLVEAAYRGELANSQLRRTVEKTPHLKPAQIAEAAVAAAAHISEAKVHAICAEVRREFHDAKRRLKPGNGLELEPPMSAAELKAYLESGPG